jgi:3-oxoacyl-[acyl-carrier-protein] synthase II
MDQAERVVVTGMGAVTAHGVGVGKLWQELIKGHVAIRPVRGVDLSGHLTRLGGEAPTSWPPGCDAALDFALTAAREAMDQAGIHPAANPATPELAPDAISATRWGVVVGTCNAGLRSAEHAWRAHRARGRPDWRRYLMIQPQILAEALSAEFGLRGPVLSVNTACASGAHAIAHAWEIIRSDQADAMLVGGTDAFTETVFAGFSSLEALSARPAAPYSRSRDGLSLGEGSGMLVLARLSVARAAGAPLLAEVAGYGLSADGYHPTAPRPGGEDAARAIAAALAVGGLDAAAVDYINGHGTGTRRNDSAESNAVRLALGPHAGNVPLSSVKSMIGHLLGAAGAVEAVATVQALRDQVAPPTAGFTEPDPGCGLDPIPGSGRRMRIDVALSNNFAFGGANATIAFTRPGRAAAPPARRPSEEVVITGVGVVSPAGASRSELWRGYTEGLVTWRWEHGLRVSRVNLDPAAFVPASHRRRLDRLSLYALAASRRALDDAKLDIGPHNGDSTGVILGTGVGPVESLEAFGIPVLGNGPGAASPAVFPSTVYNAAAGHIAMLLGTRGPTSTVTAAHAAGAAALSVAGDMLRAGRADALLCVAADALSPLALQVYAAIPLFRSRGARLCLLAEGAMAMVLEPGHAARARGARVLGRLCGHAITADAAGIAQWDPRGTGIERAMRTAMDTAALGAADISAIWANTTGLPAVDQPEHAAITRLRGTAGIAIHQPKLVLGEAIGVSALQSAALAIQGWDQGGDAGPALINSSSLGGTHISLILSPEGKRPG